LRKLGGRERGILFVGWGPINVSTCWPIKHVKILTVQAYKSQTPFLTMFYHIGHNLKLRTQSQHHCLIPCLHDADIAMAEKCSRIISNGMCALLIQNDKSTSIKLSFNSFTKPWRVIWILGITENIIHYNHVPLTTTMMLMVSGWIIWLNMTKQTIAVIIRPAMGLMPGIQFQKNASDVTTRGHDQIHPDL
jgi:hypothetical protein